MIRFRAATGANFKTSSIYIIKLKIKCKRMADLLGHVTILRERLKFRSCGMQSLFQKQGENILEL